MFMEQGAFQSANQRQCASQSANQKQGATQSANQRRHSTCSMLFGTDTDVARLAGADVLGIAVTISRLTAVVLVARCRTALVVNDFFSPFTPQHVSW